VELGFCSTIFPQGLSPELHDLAEINDNRKQNEKWTEPADHHNTTGQFNHTIHSTTGINEVSLSGFAEAPIDLRIIQTTQSYPDVFPFNLDMNSGRPNGIGEHRPLIEFIGLPEYVPGYSQVTISDGRRSSSATSYLGPQFISRKNLNVVVNTRVTRVLKTGISHDGKPQILGVEFVDVGRTSMRCFIFCPKDLLSIHTPDKKYAVQAQKELILSAGSVNTPQLLQLSGIGDRNLLSSLKIPTIVDNPSVGRNLSDHPFITNVWLANVNASDTFQAAERDPAVGEKQLQEWMTSHTGPLVATSANHLAFLRVADDFWIEDKDPAAGNHTPHFEIIFSVRMTMASKVILIALNFRMVSSLDWPPSHPKGLSSARSQRSCHLRLVCPGLIS